MEWKQVNGVGFGTAVCEGGRETCAGSEEVVVVGRERVGVVREWRS